MLNRVSPKEVFLPVKLGGNPRCFTFEATNDNKVLLHRVKHDRGISLENAMILHRNATKHPADLYNNIDCTGFYMEEEQSSRHMTIFLAIDLGNHHLAHF